VWQVIGIYLLGGWIALQVVETLVDSLGLPEWFPAFAVMLLIVGFPIVVATAFVQEGVGGGGGAAPAPVGTGVREKPRPSETIPQVPASSDLARGTGSLDRPSTRPPRLLRLLTWRNAIGGGVLAFALWGVLAAAWMGVKVWVDRELRPADEPLVGGTAMTSGSERLKSIAVLPFDNLSTDAENAFFADGIHEDVLTQLSRIGDLTVISRTSVLAYRDAATPLAEIARQLDVGTILEGSVRRSGDNVRITAQLIDAETDRHLWADNFDRALTAANVFAIQTEIAQRIADALAATLSPEEEDRLVRRPTEDLDAYLASLRGREAYRLYTDGANNEAIRLFRLAIDGDASFAEPWAGLSDAYGQRVIRYGYGLEWADSSEAAARRALELDPDLATAYKALGLAQGARGDDVASIESNLRAMELDPNYSDPVNNAGVSYQRLGRHDDAFRLMSRSYRLQPNLAFARANAAFGYALLGDFDIAHARLDEALRFDPTDPDTRLYLGFLHIFEGHADAGADVADDVLEQDPNSIFFLAWAAEANLFARRFDVAAELAQRSLELSPDQDVVGWRLAGLTGGYALLREGATEAGNELLDDVLARRMADWERRPEAAVVPFEIASVHAARGELSPALDWLEAAYEAGWRYPFYVEHDPVFDAARDDPRFQEILGTMREDVERQRLTIEREEARAGRR
jgi:TolB-like protein